MGGGFERRREQLGALRLLVALAEHPGPRRRIRRQAADEIRDAPARKRPVDPAILLEDLGSGPQRRFVDVLLFDGLDVPRGDAVHGRGDQCGAGRHQLVVERADVVFRQDRHPDLSDDAALVDLVVQEKRGDACLGLAVDDRPVDRRRPAVLGQQRRMEVEGSQPGHGPDHLGKHSEGDHDAQVGPQRLHRPDELRVFQLFGLQDGKSQLQRGDLNLALMEFPAPSGGFVGCGHHTHDVVAAGDERPQRRHGEFGRAHEYDAKVFGVHDVCLQVSSIWFPSGSAATLSK